jgi:quercetin dioxygenase-like cupin family protein
MRLLKGVAALTFVLALICLVASPVAAQDLDAVKSDSAHHKVEFENDQVRVVSYVIAPGDKTANHSHPNNVNIFLADVNAKVTTPDGKTSELHGKAGSAAWRGPVTHRVENTGDKPIVGILVEPKKPASALPAGAQDVIAADPKHTKVEFENDQVRVVRYRYEPGEKSPMHGHPDNVQVMLTDATANVTTADGKTTAISGKAGEARWREAGQHSVQNAGGKAFEGLLIEMKGAPGAKAASK